MQLFKTSTTKSHSTIFKLLNLITALPLTSSLISHSLSTNTAPIDIISKKHLNLCPASSESPSFSLYYEVQDQHYAVLAATSFKNGTLKWSSNSTFLKNLVQIQNNSFYFNYNSSSKINNLKIACENSNFQNKTCSDVDCVKSYYLWWKYDKQFLDQQYKLNYCKHSDKFISNIIKNVENGTLECKKDHTFIPRDTKTSKISLEYIWILTRKKSFKESKTDYISTGESDFINFSSVYRPKYQRVSCQILFTRHESGNLHETCNGTLSQSYPVLKLYVSDFFGWQSFNVYLLWTVAVLVVAGLIVGAVGLYVYCENRQERKIRVESKNSGEGRFSNSPTTMNLLGDVDSSETSPENEMNTSRMN